MTLRSSPKISYSIIYLVCIVMRLLAECSLNCMSFTISMYNSSQGYLYCIYSLSMKLCFHFSTAFELLKLHA